MSSAPSNVLTFLTDFGEQDAYVGAMKGVVASQAPHVTVFDISHQIGPQDLHHASFVLAQAAPWYPPGTVHVAVVDPGVGTQRRALVAILDDQWVVAPDNGLITHLYQQSKHRSCYSLTDPQLGLPKRSATFHGRDLFAPAGAQLASGQISPEDCGSPLDPILLSVEAPVYEQTKATGAVISVDRFGNLITNIVGSKLPSPAPTVDVQLNGTRVSAYVETYGSASPGSLVALIGSGGFLEVAEVEGNASKRLASDIGGHCMVSWR